MTMHKRETVGNAIAALLFEACANTSWLLMEVNDWQRAMALLVQGGMATAHM